MKTTFGKFGIEAELMEKSSLWPAVADSGNVDRYHHSRYCVSVWKIIPDGRINKVSFDFWTSAADWDAGIFEMSETSLLHAFYCLISDGLSAKQATDFNAWCREFGYEFDENYPNVARQQKAKANRAFRSCLVQWMRCERLGLDESSACDLINELNEAGI
jgi:hypothetical protein